MRTLFIFFICFSFSVSSFAQRTEQVRKVDSLLQLLAVSRADTGRAMILFELASWYETNNQDSSAYYLLQGKELAESLQFDKGIYYYYQQGAVLAYTKGNYTEALDISAKGLALARKLKDSIKVLAMLNNFGIVYSYLGEFEKQLDYTIQVKNLVEKIRDSSKYSGIWHNLANCYFNLGRYRKGADAAIYGLFQEKYARKKNGYVNRLYATLAQCYDGLKMQDSALFYYDISIKESERLDDRYAEGIIYGYKCNLLAGMFRFEDMLVSARQSITISRELQSRQMLASSLYNMAFAAYLNNNNKEANIHIREALTIAEADSLKDELKNCYIVLSFVAARDGNFTESLRAKLKADSIIEATLNEKVLKSTADLEKKYETEKKDNQIKLQQDSIRQKNTLNYILIGSAAALLVISLLGYRNYRNKQKLQQQRINELETEKQLTATEAVLKGEEQERTRLAKDLHDGLGGMLSGIKYSLNSMKGNLIMTPDNAQAFERSMDMLDSSIQEMRRVAHNMMPEALVKFGLDTALKDFCNDINQSGALSLNYQSIGLENEELDQTTAITIYRIVQELLNNTMKHAAAKNAIMQVTKSGKQISVTVEDDGKGFDTKILQGTRGMGWGNIQSRVDLLKGTIDVQSVGGKGTSVHIELTA